MPAEVPLRYKHPRARHLVREGDFKATYASGGRARCELFSVVVRPNGGAHTRLGLSVGKVAYRDATDRNRARRVLREAFRLSRHELPDGYDVILIGRAGAGRLALAPVLSELAGLVRKAARRAAERA
ncbi:MAG: ribonuclease P protein component [Planctomycetota bacterium]|nr:MAG: ribonuclease P protein component [Planctomycetota bacterium]